MCYRLRLGSQTSVDFLCTKEHVSTSQLDWCSEICYFKISMFRAPASKMPFTLNTNNRPEGPKSIVLETSLGHRIESKVNSKIIT